MRVADLVNDHEDAFLYHPTLGHVRWTGLLGRTLKWAKGPEIGEDLVVDTTVLHDDQWTLARQNGEDQ